MTQFNLSLAPARQVRLRQRADLLGLRGPSALVAQDTAYLDGDLTGTLAQLLYVLTEHNGPVDQATLRTLHLLAGRFLQPSGEEASGL